MRRGLRRTIALASGRGRGVCYPKGFVSRPRSSPRDAPYLPPAPGPPVHIPLATLRLQNAQRGNRSG